MPIWLLRCPDCHHRFRSFVMEGSRVPEVWVCSACGSKGVVPEGTVEGGPFSGPQAGCGCGCG